MGKGTTRIPMPIRMRAKQFAMFDAMKGLTEAITERERQYIPKKELAEDRIREIGNVLSELQIGDNVEISYYCDYRKTYRKVEGELKKIDRYWKEIVVEDKVISFGEIDGVEIIRMKTLPIAKSTT